MAEDKEVNVTLQKVDMPSIDVSEYVGKKVAIESVTTHASSKYDGYYLRVLSEIVHTIDGDKPVHIRASKILPLYQDKDGAIGWGEKGKTAEFLKYMKVEHPDQLVGKEVILKPTEPKDGIVYLTF
jgi:hypothetical protein